MLHSLSCLTVGGAGEGEAGEDPQEGHGLIMMRVLVQGAFIQLWSNMIGRDGMEGDVLSGHGGRVDRCS